MLTLEGELSVPSRAGRRYRASDDGLRGGVLAVSRELHPGGQGFPRRRHHPRTETLRRRRVLRSPWVVHLHVHYPQRRQRPAEGRIAQYPIAVLPQRGHRAPQHVEVHVFGIAWAAVEEAQIGTALQDVESWIRQLQEPA